MFITFSYELILRRLVFRGTMEKIHWKQLAANKMRLMGQTWSDVEEICKRITDGNFLSYLHWMLYALRWSIVTLVINANSPHINFINSVHVCWDKLWWTEVVTLLILNAIKMETHNVTFIKAHSIVLQLEFQSKFTLYKWRYNIKTCMLYHLYLLNMSLLLLYYLMYLL